MDLATAKREVERAPLVLGAKDFHDVSEAVSSIVERKMPRP